MFIRKKKFLAKIEKAKSDGRTQGLYDFVDLLKTKDKVYLDGVVMHGDGHTIENCAFFANEKTGIGVNIRAEKTKDGVRWWMEDEEEK